MFSKILIPIDLSNDDHAVELIEKSSKLGNISEITLLHVLEKIPEQVQDEFSDEFTDDEIDKAKQALNLILSRANVVNDLVKIDVREGNSCEMIIEASQDYEVDLILLDSSRQGLEKYILGSTATKVVKLAKCSVLVRR